MVIFRLIMALVLNLSVDILRLHAESNSRWGTSESSNQNSANQANSDKSPDENAAEEESSLRRWQRMRAAGNPELEREHAERVAADKAKEQQRKEREAKEAAEYQRRMQMEQDNALSDARRREINSEIANYLREIDKDRLLAAARRGKPLPPALTLSKEAELELERRIDELPDWPEMEKVVSGQSQRFRFHALSIERDKFAFDDPVLVVEQMLNILSEPWDVRLSMTAPDNTPKPILTNGDRKFDALLFECISSQKYRQHYISDERLRGFAINTCRQSMATKYIRVAESQESQVNSCLETVAKNFITWFHSHPQKDSSQSRIEASSRILLDFKKELKAHDLLR